MPHPSRRSLRLLHAVLVLCLLALLPAPASAQIYLKRVLGVESSPPHSVADSVVALARQQVGTRYTWGGERPETGFDCSGLMRHVLRAMGVDLPRTSAEQARVGEEIPRDIMQLRPGDILTFGRGSRVTHVGIYSGNGRYIHASSATGRVIEARMPRTWLLGSTWWKGARRVIASHAASAAEGRAGG